MAYRLQALQNARSLEVGPLTELLFRSSPEYRALMTLTGPSTRLPDEALDWPRVIELAISHKSLLQLQAGITSAGIEIPTVARDALLHRATLATAKALAGAATTRRIVEALREAGVQARVLKGVVVAEAIYGGTAKRDFGDIDLLIDERDISAALDVLVARGYRPPQSRRLLETERGRRRLLALDKDMELNSTSGTIVELHWRLHTRQATGTRGLEARANTCVPPASSVPSLEPVDHVLYLCAHAAIHQFSRLKWLNDLRRALREGRWIGDRWEHLVDRAEETGLKMALAVAVHVVTAIDGPLAPALTAFAARIAQADEQSSKLVCAMLAHAEGTPSSANSYIAMVRAEDNARRILGAAERSLALALMDGLFRPTARDVAMIDLPDHFAWLYPALRPFLLLVRHARRATPHGSEAS